MGKAEGVAAKNGPMQFYCKYLPFLADKKCKQAHGGGAPGRSVAKTPAFAGYHETPKQPILPQRTLYRILFYLARPGMSRRFPQKSKIICLLFGIYFGSKIGRNFVLTWFCYGNVAQNRGFSVKTPEKQNNYEIFINNPMSIFSGYITIYNNQKAVKMAKKRQKGEERNIYYQKFGISNKINENREQNG